PQVTGHQPHFVQLLQNLIENAIKYRSDTPPQISISVQQKEGMWLFAVADNGIGIAPEYHKQIFGLFKRLHGKQIPGTGIYRLAPDAIFLRARWRCRRKSALVHAAECACMPRFHDRLGSKWVSLTASICFPECFG